MGVAGVAGVAVDAGLGGSLGIFEGGIDVVDAGVDAVGTGGVTGAGCTPC